MSYKLQKAYTPPPVYSNTWFPSLRPKTAPACGELGAVRAPILPSPTSSVSVFVCGACGLLCPLVRLERKLLTALSVHEGDQVVGPQVVADRAPSDETGRSVCEMHGGAIHQRGARETREAPQPAGVREMGLEVVNIEPDAPPAG